MKELNKRQKRVRHLSLFCAVFVCSVLAVGCSVSFGAVKIHPFEVFRIIMNHLSGREIFFRHGKPIWKQYLEYPTSKSCACVVCRCRTFCVWSTDAGVDKKCSGRSLCTWYFFRSFSRSGMCHHHRLFSFCRRIRNHVWSNLRSGPGNCIIHGDCNI